MYYQMKDSKQKFKDGYFELEKKKKVRDIVLKLMKEWKKRKKKIKVG